MKGFTTAIFLLIGGVIFAQIPDGYYEGTDGLYGEALKQELHDIIDDHEEYSYDDLRDFILENTDEDPDNPNNVILLYTGRSQPESTFGGGADDWNREHVWAKSHGDFGNNPPAGTDAHHIRPTDASVNSSRGNLDFDNGGQQHNEATGCYYDDDSWEPRDAVKGDVARMIFYMAVRYEGDDGVPDLTVVDMVNTYPEAEHGKLSTLMEWHQQDPPDDFEMNRNEVVFGYQGNRNPFIDHTHFAGLIWGTPTATYNRAPKELRAYPNPADEKVMVNLPAEFGCKTILHIYSITGKALHAPCQISDESAIFNVSHLSKGYYTIYLENKREKDFRIKFLKK